MLHKKTKKATGNTLRARVGREMAQPAVARSARIAESNLDPARIPERPSVSMPGIVAKLFPAPKPSRPGKANISVEAFRRKKQDLRIENDLTDEQGDEVRLKKGAHVEVTVSADAKTASPRTRHRTT